MPIDRLDHLVLTVADIGVTLEFYAKVLGFEPVERDGRYALRFGAQKINLHQAEHEFEPKAARPTPGSGDLCFITTDRLADVAAHLAACGVPVEEGPIARNGALGEMRSLYIRDPDGNLVEVSRYEALSSSTDPRDPALPSGRRL